MSERNDTEKILIQNVPLFSVASCKGSNRKARNFLIFKSVDFMQTDESTILIQWLSIWNYMQSPMFLK